MKIPLEERSKSHFLNFSGEQISTFTIKKYILSVSDIIMIPNLFLMKEVGTF